ncbi:hypothetical protein VTL71DRAFT_9356 [Oculimacula yallundae]|uniref:Uncharacterized protein n=1 Tax=Oculimacula yallundae TaxID=86028 RepID=A0ABR4BSU6_9HELO
MATQHHRSASTIDDDASDDDLDARYARELAALKARQEVEIRHAKEQADLKANYDKEKLRAGKRARAYLQEPPEDECPAAKKSRDGEGAKLAAQSTIDTKGDIISNAIDLDKDDEIAVSRARHRTLNTSKTKHGIMKYSSSSKFPNTSPLCPATVESTSANAGINVATQDIHNDTANAATLSMNKYSKKYLFLTTKPLRNSPVMKTIFTFSPVRRLELSTRMSLNMKNPKMKHAACAYIRGSNPLTGSCSCCSKKIVTRSAGMFKKCVVLPGCFRGACANCYLHDAKRCSYYVAEISSHGTNVANDDADDDEYLDHENPPHQPR